MGNCSKIISKSRIKNYSFDFFLSFKMHSDWTGRGVTFTKTGQRSKGVHKTIKCLFAPCYDFKKLTNKPQNTGGLKLKLAKRRGKLIDKQLSSIKPCKPIQEVLILKNKFIELGLEIIHSQYVVANEETRLATPIDLIVKHKETDQIYLVEIKYGCHYRSCFVGDLKFQTKSINDCLLHQHQLQILIGRWLYNKSNIGVLLIYLDSDQINIYTEDQFEAKLTSEGIKALYVNSSSTNKQLYRKRKFG